MTTKPRILEITSCLMPAPNQERKEVMATKHRDKQVRAHRSTHQTTTTGHTPKRGLPEPLYRESQVPGRECYYAKCPKCRAIVYTERPLPHGPRSEMFMVYARRELAHHHCEEKKP